MPFRRRGPSEAASRRAPSVRGVFLAFLSVAVAFVASTTASEYGELEIRRTSREITGNSAPSIQQLAEMRGDLRQFTLLADDEVDLGLEGMVWAATAEMVAARARMERAWDNYRRLPTFPGELALWPPAEQAKSRLDGAVARLEDDMRRGRWQRARAALEGELKPAGNTLDRALMRMIEFDANQGAVLAHRIDVLGRRSITLAVLLDGISVMLTLLTAVLLWRVVRRYTSLVERRAEELELFAGRVAHDVLGPLGAATLAMEAAERDAAPGSRTQRVLGSGRAGLKRARLIADGLLEFAAAGARPHPRARADVLEVMRAVVDEVEAEAQQRGITLQIEAVRPGAVACSPGILTSLVSNLVRNAVKYVGEGPQRRIVVRARPVGARIRIEVEDNGRGLPPELGDSVFEPYVRGAGSKQPGIGLGLATVKKITEAHGGFVDVRSVPGLGCRFGVELPSVPAATSRAAARAARKEKEKEKEAVDRPAP